MVGVGVNGGAGHGEEGSGSDMSELDMDRMDGLPPASMRSRSSSVGSNANSEPLFSPIPFIVRDENGQLTHPSVQGQGAEGESGVLMDQIPDLELGGADRTQSMSVTPKEVVDVAPTAPSAAAEPAKEEQQGEDVAMAEREQQEEPLEPATNVAAAITSAAPSSTSVTAGESEPLGIPTGQVDELDNPEQTVNALTSTTTSSSEAPPATGTLGTKAEGEADIVEKADVGTQGDEKAEEEEEDAESSRSSKRRKSVASITDPRE